jgi:GH24 family phage-related lysozyme (muramidase)
MQESVKARFRGFNEPFEGMVPFMYLDVKGLVTVGVGNLIDPLELALELAFQWKDKLGVANPGQAATEQEITDEWTRLKNNTALAQKGHRACEPLTDLEINNDVLDGLIARRLAGNESFLKRQKPYLNFDNWPADAQLGLLSMAWAMGPGGPPNFRRFSAACEKMDFIGAAAECKMSEVGNPGLAPRNRANKMLFENAAVVLAGESAGTFQRAILYYPQALSKQVAVSAGQGR